MFRLCPLYSKYLVNVLYTYTGTNPTQEFYLFRKPLVTVKKLYEIINIGPVTLCDGDPIQIGNTVSKDVLVRSMILRYLITDTLSPFAVETKMSFKSNFVDRFIHGLVTLATDHSISL